MRRRGWKKEGEEKVNLIKINRERGGGEEEARLGREERKKRHALRRGREEEEVLVLKMERDEKRVGTRRDAANRDPEMDGHTNTANTRGT